VKVADLIKFRTGYLGTILDVKSEFGHHRYALVWVHGTNIFFHNPTTMSIDMLQRTAEVINESR
jgi:hypothetical protein